MFLVHVVKRLAGVGVVEATSLADGVLRVAVFARLGQQKPSEPTSVNDDEPPPPPPLLPQPVPAFERFAGDVR